MPPSSRWRDISRTSETLISHNTTRSNNPEDLDLNLHRRENLQPRLFMLSGSLSTQQRLWLRMEGTASGYGGQLWVWQRASERCPGYKMNRRTVSYPDVTGNTNLPFSWIEPKFSNRHPFTLLTELADPSGQFTILTVLGRRRFGSHWRSSFFVWFCDVVSSRVIIDTLRWPVLMTDLNNFPLMRDLRFSRRWTYNSWFSGLVRPVVWWLDTIVSEDCAAFTLKM
jgi:hypothetical protein